MAQLETAQPNDQPAATAPETPETPANGNSSKAPVLDISTIVPEAVEIKDEAYITIDGNRYPYAKVSAFSLRERHSYISRMERIAVLEGKPEPNEDDEKEYRRLLVELGQQLIPELSIETVNKLDDGQLVDIALAFFVWIGEHHPRMAVMSRLGTMGLRMAALRTGAKSLPGSNATTAETVPNGG